MDSPWGRKCIHRDCQDVLWLVVSLTGHSLQQILKCQWCVELWLCHVWDMESWTWTFWESNQYWGTQAQTFWDLATIATILEVSSHTLVFYRLSKWLMKVIASHLLLDCPKSSIRSWFNASMSKRCACYLGHGSSDMMLTTLSWQAARELLSFNILSVSGDVVSSWLWTFCLGGGELDELYWPPRDGDWSSLGNSQEPLSWITKIVHLYNYIIVREKIAPF